MLSDNNITIYKKKLAHFSAGIYNPDSPTFLAMIYEFCLCFMVWTMASI